jgi:peptide-methionine (S)-S-oxide reductase
MSTTVGYAGGSRENPTYHDLGDHTETIQIEFDPRIVTYQELLDVFWKSHDPTLLRSTQYKSIILFHNEEQRRLALESRERRQGLLKTRVMTQISAFSKFFPAEDYHQKYRLQQMPGLISDLKSVFPTYEDLLASTAAARLNGLLGGYGSIEGVRKALQGMPSSSWIVLGKIVGATAPQAGTTL